MSAAREQWHIPEDRLPPDGQVVDCMTSSGAVVKLKRIGNLWFVEDGSMYVYYVPQFWREPR